MSINKPLVQIVRLASIVASDPASDGSKYDNLETYSILWIDPQVNDAKEYTDAQERLRASINYIRTLKSVDNCEDYIQSVPEEDRIFLILSNQIGQEIVPQIHRFRQIFAIYVYTSDEKRNTHWTKDFQKIVSVSSQLDTLIARIKSDRARRSFSKIDEPLSLSLFDANVSYQSNDQFLRTHLLIDCLLRLKENSTDLDKLVQLCEQKYAENKSELNIVHEFQKNYSSARALRWYTRQSFLFRMLNKALRTQNLDTLVLFRFFIYDIQQQLHKNQCSQPMQLFRAQFVTSEQLQLLKNALGGFLMINTFLSTTMDRAASLAFLENTDQSDEFDRHRVLFEIEADPRVNGAKPFANIIWLSYCFGQQEILMMIGSIFRIVEIQSDDDQSHIIRLTLTSENDFDLKKSFEHLRRHYSAAEIDLFSFGHVLCDMGSFETAKNFYLRFLDDIPADSQDLVSCYQTLGEVAADTGDCRSSLEWYQKLHELLLRTLTPDDPRLADSYMIIGDIHAKNDELKPALDAFNKALSIYKRTMDENHAIIAACSERLGAVYEKQKKYFQALNAYEKTLAIRQKTLPPDDLVLAATHSKVANVRLLLCHYYLAVGHFHIALEIKSNALPPDHLHIASDYRGMGHMYKGSGDLGQALTYYEKAAKIFRDQLPAGHADVVEIEELIQSLLPAKK